ncbi:MAG: trimethylamine methyltransferase family protein [Desulfohalobiaceae bacterium]|nr:trimethylamine methyltransferase family protein [Desulfohalobiaceae bacterium]
MLSEQAARAAERGPVRLGPPGALGLTGLSSGDCKKIHEAGLEILQETGILVTSDKAKTVFSDHGATVDKATNRVCLPPSLIEKGLSTIPASLTIPGRTPDRDFLMGSGDLGFVNFGSTVYVNDLWTGERRKALLDDVVQVTRIMDSLDSLKILISMLNATDKSPVTETLHTLAAMMANTTKPVEAIPPTADLIPKMALMGEAAVGKETFRKRPFFFTGVCVVSPLNLVDDCSEVLMAAVEQGFTTSVLSMCLAGGTAPVHLAGTVVQHNAEVLSGLTLGQLMKPGAPMFYSSSTTTLDMRFGTAAVGSPEGAVLNAALVQMGKYYRIPVRVSGG